MADISFFVPGRPEPRGSKRSFHHKTTGKLIIVDDNPKSTQWMKDIRTHAHRWMQGKVCTKQALKCDLTFYLKRPQTHFRTGRYNTLLKDAAPVYPAVKPDRLKLARAVEDALSGIVYWDDALAVTGTVSKKYADGDIDEGVLIEVSEIG